VYVKDNGGTENVGFDPVDRISTDDGAGYLVYGDPSGQPSAELTNTFQLGTRFVYLPGGVMLTYIFGNPTNGNNTYSLSDLRGNVLASATGSGTQSNLFRYDPYGNNISYGGATPNNTGAYDDYGWEGTHGIRTYQGNPDFIQLGARLYSPTVGRFMQPDPVSGGCANAYSYTYGDPINTSDLTGEKTNCSKLAQMINSVRNELVGRYNAIKADKFRLPYFGRMSVQGHRQQFEDKQANLRSNLTAWNSDGCNNTPGGPKISGDSWKWATRPAPYPNNISIPWARYGTYVAVGVGVGVAVYATGGLILVPAAAL
jgi:RHS repeat-associated protein